MELLKRRLGNTGVEVTAFGLGGEGVLRTFGREREAEALIRRAIELGVTYFDCAHAYAGSEDYHGRVWGSDPAARDRIFLCSKSAERRAREASAQLELTLKRMRTDRLDLWQVHDVRTEAEWQVLMGPGGALEAFVRARQEGKVRHIGITGHHDPAVLTRALREFPFDTVLMPVNAAEGHLRGFMDETMPVALEKAMGVIGMKVLGGGTYVRAGMPAGPLLRYALGQQVSTIIVGCGSVAELEANLREVMTPAPAGEERAILAALGHRAREAAYYRGVTAER